VNKSVEYDITEEVSELMNESGDMIQEDLDLIGNILSRFSFDFAYIDHAVLKEYTLENKMKVTYQGNEEDSHIRDELDTALQIAEAALTGLREAVNVLIPKEQEE
jgi:predicted mannosyl-3-phosphoglycerate phosphatase (HAD superfamily)